MLMAMEANLRVLELLASASGALALWAQTRVKKAVDPVADLTERLRAPLAWTIKHPLQALARRIVR